MAVYNTLTQNKQGKGPVFYLLEKLHTLTWIALAREENKQPTKPPSNDQNHYAVRTYLYLYMYISTERKLRVRWRTLPKCINQTDFSVLHVLTRTRYPTLIHFCKMIRFFSPSPAPLRF
jgi:hypothetical protein